MRELPHPRARSKLGAENSRRPGLCTRPQIIQKSDATLWKEKKSRTKPEAQNSGAPARRIVAYHQQRRLANLVNSSFHSNATLAS